MAGVYRRGQTWWGRAQRQGKEHRRSLGTRDRRTAEKRLRQWLGDLEAQGWGDKPPREWRDVALRFAREHFPIIKPASAKRYGVSLKNLDRAFSGRTIQQVTTAALSEFETMRRTEGVSAPTIRRDFACLSAIFTYCEEWEWIDDGRNIVPAYLRKRRRRGLKESDPRTRYLSEAEEAALIEACSEPCRTAVILSIDSGLRDQELFSLTWAQIDQRRGIIHTSEDTKSRRKRPVPLAQRSAQALGKLPRHIISPFVFCHANGDRIGRTIKGFKGACRRAGLADVKWHDLRRTAGCRWLQRDGRSIEEVRDLLGHRDASTTQRSYAFLNLEETAQKQAQGVRSRA